MKPIQFTVWAVNIGYSYWSSDGHHRQPWRPWRKPPLERCQCMHGHGHGRARHHRHATGDPVPGLPLGVLAFIVPLARIVAAIVVGWKEPKSLPSAFARPS